MPMPTSTSVSMPAPIGARRAISSHLRRSLVSHAATIKTRRSKAQMQGRRWGWPLTGRPRHSQFAAPGFPPQADDDDPLPAPACPVCAPTAALMALMAFLTSKCLAPPALLGLSRHGSGQRPPRSRHSAGAPSAVTHDPPVGHSRQLQVSKGGAAPHDCTYRGRPCSTPPPAHVRRGTVACQGSREAEVAR
jgi:hypothetical protein